MRVRVHFPVSETAAGAQNYQDAIQRFLIWVVK